MGPPPARASLIGGNLLRAHASTLLKADVLLGPPPGGRRRLRVRPQAHGHGPAAVEDRPGFGDWFDWFVTTSICQHGGEVRSRAVPEDLEGRRGHNRATPRHRLTAAPAQTGSLIGCWALRPLNMADQSQDPLPVSSRHHAQADQDVVVQTC